jgi:hypothetical protein
MTLGRVLMKRPLTGSPIGKGIPVVGTAVGSPTLLHAIGATQYERHVVRLYASNPSDEDVTLYLLFGELALTSLIEITIPVNQGLFALVPEMVVKQGAQIGAYVDSGNENKVIIFGDVDIEENVPT